MPFHSITTSALVLSWLARPSLAVALDTRDHLMAGGRLEDHSHLTAIIPVQEVQYHWTTNVSIGGQQVLLCIDTGSTPSWVTGSQAVTGPGGSYNVSNSATAQLYINESFYEGFPQSSISGIVVEDTVTLADGGATVNNFAIGVVDHKSPGIANQPFDGFLGLGFPGGVGPNLSFLDSKPTFFELLMPALESPVLTLNFKDIKSDLTTGPYMEFGRVDPTKFIDNLSKTPITRSTNRWTAGNVTFSINGTQMNEQADLVFDTGGDNFINAPFAIINEYYSGVPDLRWGSQGTFNCTIIVPCDSHLPDLEMHIGNGTATIRGEYMNGRPLDGPVNPSWTQGEQSRMA
ncbi:MAG: hypothetical protein LQ352_000145 [Teloschistes flavicans]|nr:MAG: hypothetical protein LQ352_000145 [Teloschistes flavicans]